MDKQDFAPIAAWIERRRACVRQPGYAWVARDPVVGCLAPWLHLAGRGGLVALDPPAQQGCAAAYYENLGRRSAWQGELRRVMAALQSHGIERIGLKGAVLAETLYPDPGLRKMGDVDVLVRGQDYARATHLLLEQGLRVSPENAFDSLAALDALPAAGWPTELIFCGRAGLVVELHSHLLSSDWFLPAFPVEVETVWQRAHALPGGGLWSAELGPDELLAYLVLHQAMHGLQAMHVYVDLDRLVRSLPTGWDWQPAHERLRAWGLQTAAFHVLRFCQAFMDTPAPQQFLARLDPGRLSRRRLDTLIRPADVLGAAGGPAGRRRWGLRYPTMVKLALVDRSTGLLPALRKVLLPGRDWLRTRYPQQPTLRTHWGHVFQVVRRGD